MLLFGRARKFLLLGCLAAFLLTAGGCAGLGGPFASESSDVTEVYYADIPDVPIPKDMGYDGGKSDIKNVGGMPTGYMYFSGPIEWLSLQNACAYNMYREGWSPLSIYKSKHGIMVFEKAGRVCTIVVSDSFPSNTMQIWVTPKMNGFTEPPAMPTSNRPVESTDSESYSGSTAPESSGGSSGTGSAGGSPGGGKGPVTNVGGGVKEQGLSE